MKTVLLSTSACWNCGDDWIREGLLHCLRLRPDVRVLWWNRGYGVQDAYQNALAVNLPLTDYVIAAGTPEWIDKNERILEWCLEHGTRIAWLGVGRTGGYIEERHGELVKALAASGLVEIAIPRDPIAYALLKKWGFAPTAPMCDPALFVPPLQVMNRDLFVLCWRGLGETGPRSRYSLPSGGGRARLNRDLARAYRQVEGPKMVVVHENRELHAARKLFGEDAYFSSNPEDLRRVYARARYYVGMRIHGWVLSAIHGAPGHLIYPSPKAAVVETVIKRCGWGNSGKVSYMERETCVPDLNLSPGLDTTVIARERDVFRDAALSAPGLAELMRGA